MKHATSNLKVKFLESFTQNRFKINSKEKLRASQLAHFFIPCWRFDWRCNSLVLAKRQEETKTIFPHNLKSSPVSIPLTVIKFEILSWREKRFVTVRHIVMLQGMRLTGNNLSRSQYENKPKTVLGSSTFQVQLFHFWKWTFVLPLIPTLKTSCKNVPKSTKLPHCVPQFVGSWEEWWWRSILASSTGKVNFSVSKTAEN